MQLASDLSQAIAAFNPTDLYNFVFHSPSIVILYLVPAALLATFWFHSLDFVIGTYFAHDRWKLTGLMFLGSFIWSPLILFYILWFMWVEYRRAMYISGLKYVLLEVRLPREVSKSPLAMELALSGLHQTGRESNWYDKYWLGKIRTWFSFEIASIEGVVHFFIRTEEGFRNLVESQLYGQYPGVEIFEVKDYTEQFSTFDKDKHAMFGYEMKLSGDDPLPIKTYVDYGLDKDPKEEFKVDPLTSVLEYMGTCEKGEHMWIQFIVEAHKKKHKEGTFFGETDWKEEGKELIKKITSAAKEEAENQETGKKEKRARFLNEFETNQIKAIDRSISKLGFDVGGRVIYIAEKDLFKGARINPILSMLKVFSSNALNSISSVNGTGFDFWWQDYDNIRLNQVKAHLVAAYRTRGYFHPPFKGEPFVLNTEELATVYHLPGSVASTPTLVRTLSSKAEAPGNLPR